jgi:hypothetical protein
LWLAVLALGGCVSQNDNNLVLSAPPVTTAADTASIDPMGLQAAIALVRQRTWCAPSTASRRP